MCESECRCSCDMKKEMIIGEEGGKVMNDDAADADDEEKEEEG